MEATEFAILGRHVCAQHRETGIYICRHGLKSSDTLTQTAVDAACLESGQINDVVHVSVVEDIRSPTVTCSPAAHIRGISGDTWNAGSC